MEDGQATVIEERCIVCGNCVKVCAQNAKRIEKIRGRDVVLVDDVLTSGATSDACTKALLKAGATSVSIACFARVMNEVLHGDAAALRETKT